MGSVIVKWPTHSQFLDSDNSLHNGSKALQRIIEMLLGFTLNPKPRGFRVIVVWQPLNTSGLICIPSTLVWENVGILLPHNHNYTDWNHVSHSLQTEHPLNKPSSTPLYNSFKVLYS